MRRDVFQAIADPIRRDIIGLLAEDELTINAIAEQFDISRPAISKHLKILQECGLVDFRQDGRERYCRIMPKELVPAFMWIDQYKRLWEDQLDAFEDYLLELKHKRQQHDINRQPGTTNDHD